MGNKKAYPSEQNKKSVYMNQLITEQEKKIIKTNIGLEDPKKQIMLMTSFLLKIVKGKKRKISAKKITECV